MILRSIFHSFRIFLGLALMTAVLASAIIPAAPAQAQTEDDALGQLSPLAQEVAQRINLHRSEAGLPPLAVHALLNQAAQNHANDIVQNGAYGHIGSDGSWVQARVARTGYALDNAGTSENWVTETSVAGAVGWWMNDWIHRVNMLNPKWRDLGVGVSDDGNSGWMIFITVFAGQNGQPPGEGVVAVQPAVQEQAVSLDADGRYTIQPGDTLLGIGLRLGVAWQEIAAINGLTEHSVLQIGGVITMPGVSTPDHAAAAELASAQGIAGPLEPYAVQAGDTLVSIAAHAGATWQELAVTNGLGEFEVLQIGQIVQIPAQSDDARPSQEEVVPSQAPEQYTVIAGDTLVAIAYRYGLDWQQMLALNGLSEESLLQPGQSIRLR